MAAGGSFGSGAVNGAFGYLFNHCSHNTCTTKLEQMLYDWMPGYKAGTLLYNQVMGDGSWTGWEVLDAASVGPGALATKAGMTVFKTGHYASRLEAAGVNVARAESAIAKEVGAMRPNMAAGADVSGRLRIDNVLVEYRTRLLPDGSVNVGTIFPVR